MKLNTAALNTSVLNGSAANTQSLAGQLAAGSSFTGALDVVKGIAAGAVCTVGLVGNVTNSIPLGGSSTAQATPVANLVDTIPLAGSGVSSTTYTAELTRIANLGGVVTNRSTSAGAIVDTIPLDTLAVGSSSATGNVKLQVPLGGSSASNAYGLGGLHQDIPIAVLAGTAAITNLISATTSVEFTLKSNAVVSASMVGSIKNTAPLGTQASGRATAAGYATVDYIVAGAAASESTIVGDIPLIINLQAGVPTNALGSNTLGSSLLGDGDSFIRTQSTSSGAIALIFYESAELVCQSYAIGALLDTIPLATLEGTSSVSNTISALPHLDIPIAGAASARGTGVGDPHLDIPIAGSAAARVVIAADLGVIKNVAGSVRSEVTTQPVNTSVHYRIDGVGSVESSGVGNPHIDKPLTGNAHGNAAGVANAKVDYVIAANVSVLFSIEANLHKTDNLSDLEGTAAVSNVIGADIHIKKNLVGVLPSLATLDGNVVSAHAIDLDDPRVQDRTYADLDLRIVTADVYVGAIYADVDEGVFMHMEESIQSWPLAA
jgi:hypothetical protein